MEDTNVTSAREGSVEKRKDKKFKKRVEWKYYLQYYHDEGKRWHTQSTYIIHNVYRYWHRILWQFKVFAWICIKKYKQSIESETQPLKKRRKWKK